jgi:hypothetical protein
MSKNKTRRKKRIFVSTQKTKIVLRCLQDGVTVSQICEEEEITVIDV